MMDWQDISVFISSTFNDMHAERDYLLKNVFPQLGEWCERRRIFLRDIDLRWGVTRVDSATGNTIYKCLTAVDSCRPFFLCFLGQRRGYVPPLEKLNARTRAAFPEIVEMARKGEHSATEYEIEHALLMPLAFFENGALRRPEPVRNALFLRRRPDYLAALSPAQKRVFLDWQKDACDTPEGYAAYLDGCKKANETCYRRISEKNLVVDYDCRWHREIVSPELRTDDPSDDRAHGRLTDFTVRAGNLPRALRKELEAILRREFPEELPSGDTWPLKAFLLASLARQFLPYARGGADAGDPYVRDADQQRVFLNTILKDAIPRAEGVSALAAYRADPEDRRPLVLLADAGMGKTTVMAQFARSHSGKGLVYRFLGMSELSGGLLPLWDGILRECGLPAPEDVDALRAKLPELLKAMAPRTLMLDGLEQIPGGLDLLELLPAPLPPGMKVILSVRSDLDAPRLAEALRFHESDFGLARLKPLETSEKEKLVEVCLSASLKELSPKQMALVCGLNESGNPLYLSILLSDIRAFSSSSRLVDEIARHGGTPQSAFDALLSRMETDRMYDMLPPERCVPMVFGLLAQARDGLSYAELTDGLADAFPDAPREARAGSVQICLRQVRAFLCRRDGRTDFRHQAFRAAAQARYAAREGAFHAALARVFRAACDPAGDGRFPRRDPRALREYAWHLAFVSEPAFRRLYADICYLNARCEGRAVRTLIQEYDHPSLGTGFEPYRNLLVRFRDALERYPNLLPSLLWAYGADEQRAEAGFDRLTCPWLRTEAMPAATATAATAPTEARRVRVLGQADLHAAAFCLAEPASLAFAFTGRGQVTAYAPDSLLPLSNPLFTAKAQPLGLCACENRLAAAFEDDRVELYEYQADGGALRARLLESLSYLTPMYGGAAMAFDRAGRLWFQPEEAVIARYDPASGETLRFSLPGAEELSSLVVAGGTIYGTACAGRGTLLFSASADGGVHTRDLGNGDSRALCADDGGCLVSCAAADGAYPLLLIDAKLNDVKRDALPSPVTAALSLGGAYLLLPAKQTLGELWLWDGEIRAWMKQRLLYQDQAQMGRLPDGSVAIVSAGAVTRFGFEGETGQSAAAVRRAPEPPSLSELPDLSRFELKDARVCAGGNYACVAGISATMRAVRDERSAGAVFLKRALGRWRVCGEQTWPRACERVRAVCVDPEQGVFTLVLRSAEKTDALYALRGTAEELSAGRAYGRELDLSAAGETCGCFAGGCVYLSSGGLLLVFDGQTLDYQTGLSFPMPVSDIWPDGDRAVIRFGEHAVTTGMR